MNINFIINNNSNHLLINNEGGGASELLFYNTAKALNGTIFNNFYKNLDSFNVTTSIVIVQRNFGLLIDYSKKYSNKYFLWSHDFLENDFSHLSGNYSSEFINEYFKNNCVTVIAVSDFHKNNLLLHFPDVNIIVIYNALFPNVFPKIKTIKKNQILFASNWAKGLNNVLKISESYYKIDKTFKLILLKPSYCNYEPELNYPFVNVIGNIKNKNEYCKIISESICVITTSYPETFGCVFAESLHLGTPVIADDNVCAGFHEFIPDNFKINFNEIDKVVIRIQQIKINNPNVSLPLEFYENNVINEWKNLLVV